MYDHSKRPADVSELLLTNALEEGEKFTLWLHFNNGTHTDDGKPLPLQESIEKAKRHIDSPAAKLLGTVIRITLVDKEDNTVFDWGRERGLTFPPPPEGQEPYGKWG